MNHELYYFRKSNSRFSLWWQSWVKKNINIKKFLINCFCFLMLHFGTPLQYSFLENPMDGGAWWATVHGVAKSQTRLSDFTFTFHVHAWEKEMATYSSVLAWRIPGTGEPSGLPSMGLHRVGHDWSDLAAAAAALEKEMATHSSVLAWRIPGMGEPGGLPSMGSHRVRHDWSDLAAAAAWVSL